jgi:acyl-CoA synthetase (AMP-forming)/AMP-acid ligase II
VGEIWVSGASVALGYWNRPAETAGTFCAYLADTGEGPFLRTGDLGFFVDGQLVIAGRLKDLIILGGRNHYPHVMAEVEPRYSNSNKRNGSAVQTDEIAQAIREAVAKHHGLRVHDVCSLNPGRIPKTTSGKIQRNACRTWYLKENMISQDDPWSRGRTS